MTLLFRVLIVEVKEHIKDEMDSRNVGAVILADDEDEDTLTYTLGGADADFFTVEKVATGVQLKTATEVVLDYEIKTEYMVTITVSDGNTAVDATIMVNIGVTDNSIDNEAVNTNPSFALSRTTRSIMEGTGVREVGAPVDTTDVDSGDTLKYTHSGIDAPSFTINMATGQLSTASAVTLEYDGPSAKRSYSVTVSVSDGKDARMATPTATQLTTQSRSPSTSQTTQVMTILKRTTRRHSLIVAPVSAAQY